MEVFPVSHSCYSFFPVVRSRNHCSTRAFREISKDKGSWALTSEVLGAWTDTWELGLVLVEGMNLLWRSPWSRAGH